VNGRLFAVICLVYIAAVSPVSAQSEKVMVRVNSEVILKSKFDDKLEPALAKYRELKKMAKEPENPDEIRRLKQEVLDQLINERLLLQEAKARSLKVSRRELEKGLETIRNRFPSDEAFRAQLKKEKMTEKQLEEKIEGELIVMRMISEINAEARKHITPPTEEDARREYTVIRKIIDGEEPPSDRSTEEQNMLRLLARQLKQHFDEQVRVRHILIAVPENATESQKSDARKKLEGIRKQIAAGEDFSEMARLWSDDPSSKEKGGELQFSRGVVVPEFEKAAFALKEGEMSGIVQTSFGFHLIKCIERRSKREVRFNDEVRDALINYLTERRIAEFYEQFLDGLKKKAAIKVVTPIH
jgi:peptidyl-prolyl cis-trans isomerase C